MIPLFRRPSSRCTPNRLVERDDSFVSVPGDDRRRPAVRVLGFEVVARLDGGTDGVWSARRLQALMARATRLQCGPAAAPRAVLALDLQGCQRDGGEAALWWWARRSPDGP